MRRDMFIDLDKERVKLIKAKVQAGLLEFKENPKQQEAMLEFSRPVLEKLLQILEKEQ